MSTLYFHIPFCKKACHYCDFHFSTVHKTYDLVIESLLKELELRANYLSDKTLSSISFGGGTPSLLKENDLKSLLGKAAETFVLDSKAEITLEANPDDLNLSKLKAIQSAGVNRLSIGIQSFFDAHLVSMNRSHHADQAIACIKNAQDVGFENITIDLIFGLPDLSLQQWEDNIHQALELGVPHISAYSLTVETKTALHKMVESGKVHVPKDETVLKQYERLTKMLQEAGYDHYELSNYGKPGFHSKHNTSYWAGDHYLGLGPSAHSFDGKNRQWNVANNTKYCKAVSNGETWFEREELSKRDRFNEFIMTGLRTSKGVSIHSTEQHFGQGQGLIDRAAEHLNSGNLILEDKTLKIPESNWMMSDMIIGDLFWTE